MNPQIKEAFKAAFSAFIMADIAYCMHQCSVMYRKRCAKWEEEDSQALVDWGTQFLVRVGGRCVADPRSRWPGGLTDGANLFAAGRGSVAPAPGHVLAAAPWEGDELFQLIWGGDGHTADPPAGEGGVGPDQGGQPPMEVGRTGRKRREANDYIDLEELTHLHLPDGSKVVYPPAWALLRASQAVEALSTELRARAREGLEKASTLPARTQRISGLRFRLTGGDAAAAAAAPGAG